MYGVEFDSGVNTHFRTRCYSTNSLYSSGVPVLLDGALNRANNHSVFMPMNTPVEIALALIVLAFLRAIVSLVS